jgi:hypothetical protein
MQATKHLLTALTATFLLLTAVSTASARNLSVSNQNIRATWTLLEFAVSREVSIRCQVTLEGSFHTRTIAKVADALIGAITKAIVKQEACREGTISMFNGTERYNGTATPNTLPWHLQYRSFTGTLPAINAVRIALSRFRYAFRDSFGLCTGQYGNESDALQADAAREAGGGISSLIPVEGSNNATLIRRDAGILCPNPGRLRGQGLVTLLGATTRITITLI